MVVFDLIVITMKTKEGKTLYLSEDKVLNNNKLLCKWTFNKNEALGFETEKEAENFAKDYFKNFNDWGYDSLIINDTDF